MKQDANNQRWHKYTGNNSRHPRKKPVHIPMPPPWRLPPGGMPTGDDYPVQPEVFRPFVISKDNVDLINLAIYLRRPLLVTGSPGVGKTTLAYDIAHELGLGKVLVWPINSRTTLQDGLYHYDAIGRLHALAIGREEKVKGKRSNNPDQEIGKFIRLGPLGTALLPRKSPRVLIIDEFDKSDYDLPNDLLYVFEKGEFEIPELRRITDKHPLVNIRVHDIAQHDEKDVSVLVKEGKIECSQFPIVVITSNEERELPAAFLRRCIRLEIADPDEGQLQKIVEKHMGNYARKYPDAIEKLLREFVNKREDGLISTDALLNAVYLMSKGLDLGSNKGRLREIIIRNLDKPS